MKHLFIVDNFSVAFHTMVNGNPIINSNQQVIFDDITMNMGNGYEYILLKMFIHLCLKSTEQCENSVWI